MDYQDFYGLTNAMEFNSITTFDCRAKGIINFVFLTRLCDDILSYYNVETDGRIQANEQKKVNKRGLSNENVRCSWHCYGVSNQAAQMRGPTQKNT